MPNVCFYMIAFNSDHVLEPVLKTLQPFGPVVVAEGPVEYWQRRGYTTSTDNTNQILHSYLPPENIVHGQWREKDDMQRAAESLIPDNTTHVWIVDADEVYHSWDIDITIANLDDLDSVAFRAASFWAGFERTIGGFEAEYEVQRIKRWYPGATFATHRPPTVLDANGISMQDKRHVTGEQMAKRDIFMYHYSYVFPSQVIAKHAYYRDRDPAGCIPLWPWEVYANWLQHGAHVEDEYNGVHNWLPERRGSTRTRAFDGNHPAEIRREMKRLMKRLKKEQAGL